MKKLAWSAVALSGLVVGAWLGLSLSRGGAVGDLGRASLPARGVGALGSKVQAAGSARERSEVKAASVSSLPAREVSSAVSEQTRRVLDQLAAISRKAFITDEDKALRKKVFADSRFMREAGAVLRSRALDQETRRQQYQAIDALVLSAVEGSTEARIALKDVVSDTQVEETSLPHDVRENLAGVKAEVLFTWSARDPSIALSIETTLPGDVSRKIWQNVSEAQARNVAEVVELHR